MNYKCAGPEKYLANSYLMEITSAPKNIMTGSKWDNLSHEIWLKFTSNQQTETTYKNKMMLWKSLYVYIKVKNTK